MSINQERLIIIIYTVTVISLTIITLTWLNSIFAYAEPIEREITLMIGQGEFWTCAWGDKVIRCNVHYSNSSFDKVDSKFGKSLK